MFCNFAVNKKILFLTESPPSSNPILFLNRSEKQEIRQQWPKVVMVGVSKIDVSSFHSHQFLQLAYRQHR